MENLTLSSRAHVYCIQNAFVPEHGVNGMDIHRLECDASQLRWAIHLPRNQTSNLK